MDRKRRNITIIGIFIVTFILNVVYLRDFKEQMISLEQTRGMNSLSDLAVQGAAIAESRIKGSIDVLWSMARAMKGKDDIQSDYIMEYLQDTIKDGNVNFIKMGIVDKNGNARITDGKEENVKNRAFFQEAMKGKAYISSVVRQEQGEQECLSAAVPLEDSNHRINGVLYGIIDTKNFDLYVNTKWDVKETDQYIHIIDEKGNYIVRSRNKNRILDGDNFYEGMEKVHSTVSIKKIKHSLKNRKKIQTQVHKGKDTRYVYLAPMKINNWCVVTVLTGNVIDEQFRFSREAVVTLVVKMLLTIFIFVGFYYKFLTKRMQEIEKLNKELDIKDKMYRLATSQIGNYVFFYNGATDTLEFMNHSREKLPIPEMIEHFSERYEKYIRAGSQTDQEIKRLLLEVKEGKTDLEGEMLVGSNSLNPVYYQLKAINVSEKKDGEVRIVGSLKDITEEKKKELKIQKGVQIRSAVLADTIGFFEVDLNRDCMMRDGELKPTIYTYTENLHEFCDQRVSESYREKVKTVFSVSNLFSLYQNGVYDLVLEYLSLSEEGKEFWAQCEVHLEKDVVTGDVMALALVRNIDAKKQNELELKKKAILDPLTKVFNRSAGIEKINAILSRNVPGENALLLLDLDNFKEVNDNLGHLVGDTVLVDVSNILRNHVRTSDVVCRLGGDEFVVFLANIPEEVIGRNVSKLLQKLNLIYERDGISEEISASVGIAVTPGDGNDFQELYEKADKALYEVKKSRKNNYRFYQKDE